MELFFGIASTFGWVVASYFIADFITGVVHWAEDTWTAPGRSRLLDRYVVFDNLEHHRRPGSIRGGSYWMTNAPSLAIAGGIAIVLVLCDVTAWQAYLALAFASQGNQVHKWAHSSDRPAIVAALQRVGLLQSRGHHGLHHIKPYDVHFCALSNYLNPVLDRVRFWRIAERVIEELGGHIARCTPARLGY